MKIYFTTDYADGTEFEAQSFAPFQVETSSSFKLAASSGIPINIALQYNRLKPA